jgi:glyoxylase-like metal-dependent hydrolase (beta-lactamase superfamily II)
VYVPDPYEVIDTHMHGQPGITGTFLVRGEKTALIETGPKSSLDSVLAALERLGVQELDHILVTHIHLDHSGAAGALVKRFPDAEVAVHEVGAPHLVDPSKLWSSAARIYGDAMETLWGGVDPIPEGNIRVLRDGDTVDLGGRKLRAIESPGHARHHHAFFDEGSGTVFTGDAVGVRLVDVGVLRPATPPPEFHLEDAKSSIRKISELGASALCFTHFGPTDHGSRPSDVKETCEAAIEALDRWAEWIRDARTRTSDIDEVAAEVRARSLEALAGDLPADAADKMERTTSDRMNTWGYMRYLDKHEGSAKDA